MPFFMTAEQMAKWAEDRALQEDYAKFTVYAPQERVMMMLDMIHKVHYHIIAPDIRRACAVRAGIPETA